MRRLTKRWIYIAAATMAVITLSIVYQGVARQSKHIGDLKSVFSDLMGSNTSRSTLILFSNNAERRYGGGFIGSVGYIQSSADGKVTIDPIHSVYYYDHNIAENDPLLEDSPLELRGLTPKVWLRDSGYSLSWPDNAKRAASLFEHESGKRVDNVVMLTPNVIKEALRVSGPIYLPDYKTTVTADNFLDKVQLEVEAGEDKVVGKDPKTILGVLANKLLAELYDGTSINSLARYVGVVGAMARQKQIAIYSKYTGLEARLSKLGLAGGLLPADGNYLSVSEANVAANKSSPFINQSVHQELKISEDGSAKVELTISRKHTGKYSHSYVDPHDGQTKWLVGANFSYIKVALPTGSAVLSSSFGQSRPTYVESGRSVVTFESSLEPGAQADYKMTYLLPFRYDLHGKLKVVTSFDKPQGSFDQDFSWDMTPPPGYRLAAGKSRGRGASKETIISTAVFANQNNVKP